MMAFSHRLRSPGADICVDITRPLGEMMDACSTNRRAAEVRRSSYWQPPVWQERSTVAEQFGFSPARGESVPYRLDHIDRQIVALLLKDGRMSCAAIARSIGRLSERGMSNRIERLTRSGVIQVGAVVNPQALGLDVIADVFLEVAPGQVREVAQRFAALENVSYVAGSIGNGDLSIQVCLCDTQELLHFVDEVVGTMPGVTRTRTVLVPWKLKDVHQWSIPRSFDDEALQDEREV